jgi:hypothetical protein
VSSYGIILKAKGKEFALKRIRNAYENYAVNFHFKEHALDMGFENKFIERSNLIQGWSNFI